MFLFRDSYWLKNLALFVHFFQHDFSQCLAFFLIYVAISILFAMKQKPHLKGYVDASLVFGVPLLSFGLQGALVYNIEYGLASLGAFQIWENAQKDRGNWLKVPLLVVILLFQ